MKRIAAMGCAVVAVAGCGAPEEGRREAGALHIAAPADLPSLPAFLRATLTWDQDESDMDLHLVNLGQGGLFTEQPFDCYGANATPDWWIPSDFSDDPALDIDDTTGFGPEHINYPHPAPGNYEVWVHFWSDDNLGPSDATVELTTSGVLPEYTAVRTLTVGSGWRHAWHVADVNWPTGGISAVDELIEWPLATE